MKLNVAVIAVAVAFAMAAASPVMEAEKLAEGPHSAYADGKFVQGASATVPSEHLMAPSPAASQQIHASDKLPESAAAYRARYQDPSRLQNPSERAKTISNHLVYMFHSQGETPTYNPNFLRQTAKLISEGDGKDPAAKGLSEHLNLMATVIEQEKTLSPEIRSGVQQAAKDYLKSHPTIGGEYVKTIRQLNARRAEWPRQVAYAINNLAHENRLLREQNQMLNQRLHQNREVVEALFHILPPESKQAVKNHIVEHREAFRLRREEELRRANVNGAERYPQGESHYATAPAHSVNKPTSAEAEHIHGGEPHAATKSNGVDAPHGAAAPTSESDHNLSHEGELDDEDYDDEDFYDDEDYYDDEEGESPYDEDEEHEFHNGQGVNHHTPEQRGKVEESQVAGPTANSHPAPSNEKAAPASAPIHQ